MGNKGTEEKKGISVLGILLTVVFGVAGTNMVWMTYSLGSIHTDISSLRTDMDAGFASRDLKMDDVYKELAFLANKEADKNSPSFYGNLSMNNTTSRAISVLTPTNESTFKESALVTGIAKLHKLDYIYVISKIANEYWVSIDCGISESGRWKGTRECIFPDTESNCSKKYEVFAIITDRLLRIGDHSYQIPNYLAKSSPVYININH